MYLVQLYGVDIPSHCDDLSVSVCRAEAPGPDFGASCQCTQTKSKNVSGLMPGPEARVAVHEYLRARPQIGGRDFVDGTTTANGEQLTLVSVSMFRESRQVGTFQSP